MQTLEATSIGTIAMLLQTNVSRVERAAAKLQLSPVLVLNNIRHFSEQQIEAIRKELK